MDGFSGLAAFLNINYGIQAGSQISVSPSSQTQAWFLGQVANQANYISSPLAGGGAGSAGNNVFFNGCKENNQQVSDQPMNLLPVPTPPAYPAGFVDTMLNLTRNAQDLPLTDLASGITDARLYRITFNNCGLGLHITGNAVAPTPVPTATPFQTASGAATVYCYPQPAQSGLNMVYPSGSTQQVRVNVYAFSGEEVATFTANAQAGTGNQTNLSVQAFAPGVYFYVIHGLGSGKVEAKGKFLVTH